MRDNSMLEILIADDDFDDRMLIEDAFVESKLRNPISFVENGEELLDRLRCTGKFSDQNSDRLPGLIILDLNMPRMDGREALSLIKADPRLKLIPVVVLTTSKAEEDIIRTYDLGVNSFIQKPVTFDGLVDVVRTLNRYWIEIVHLPPTSARVAA
ncbi:MAG: response regulator [Pseudomonadota bacterium]